MEPENDLEFPRSGFSTAVVEIVTDVLGVGPLSDDDPHAADGYDELVHVALADVLPCPTQTEPFENLMSISTLLMLYPLSAAGFAWIESVPWVI